MYLWLAVLETYVTCCMKTKYNNIINAIVWGQIYFQPSYFCILTEKEMNSGQKVFKSDFLA